MCFEIIQIHELDFFVTGLRREPVLLNALVIEHGRDGGLDGGEIGL